MDNLIEIKEKLDALYEEYKKNKSQLNKEKTKLAANLIVEMTFSDNVNSRVISLELARFPADVVNIYFETITKGMSIPVDLLDELLKEFYSTDKNAKLSQYYVSKYAFAITSVMKNYKDNASNSVQLPVLVAFIARFAIQSNKNKEKFRNLINNTTGGIYMLDYTSINRSSLTNIWNATKSIFPDLSKAKYESFITEWGKKYGFIEKSVVETSVTKEKNIVSNKTLTEEVLFSEQSANSNENSSESIEETIVPEPENDFPGEINAKKLYDSLKKDMTKEQETIITAFTDMITPIGKAFESIQGEISKSREISAENVTLRARAEDLERQLSEQRSRLQEVNQSLMTAKTENDELKKQISALESQNSELDSKLNDAYAINSRESSLEAERIRSELKKAFAFLYDDWLEYEFSDVSEENYESLQAIIKKIFRSLERNGIDFKGNN